MIEEQDLYEQLMMKPFVDACLMFQGGFLCILWAILFIGWAIYNLKNSQNTASRGLPNRMHWVLATLIGGITMVTALKDFQPVHALLAVAIGIGGFLSVMAPSFAICFSLSMLLMRPWEIQTEGTVMNFMPRFSVFFSFCWAAFYLIVVDRFAVRLNKAVVYLLLFAVWTFLSTFISESPGASRGYFFETMARSLILFFLIFQIARDRFSVWALKITLIMILMCVAVISIYFYKNDYTEEGRLIAFGMFRNTNDVAAVMTLMIGLAASPFYRKGSGIIAKLVSLLPITIGMLIIIYSQSRGALLSVIAIGGTMILKKVRRKMLALFAIACLGIVFNVGLMVLKRDAGDLEGSSASRMSFWKSGVRMAIFNPVLGVGFGGFPSNFERYATEIVGEYGHRTAHSSWVLALAETGWLGLFFFFMFSYHGGYKAAQHVFDEDPSWLYAITSYGTAMSFLSHTFLTFPYIFLGIIICASLAKSEDTKPYLKDFA